MKIIAILILTVLIGGCRTELVRETVIQKETTVIIREKCGSPLELVNWRHNDKKD